MPIRTISAVAVLCIVGLMSCQSVYDNGAGPYRFGWREHGSLIEVAAADGEMRKVAMTAVFANREGVSRSSLVAIVSLDMTDLYKLGFRTVLESGLSDDIGFEQSSAGTRNGSVYSQLDWRLHKGNADDVLVVSLTFRSDSWDSLIVNDNEYMAKQGRVVSFRADEAGEIRFLSQDRVSSEIGKLIDNNEGDLDELARRVVRERLEGQ